MVRIIKCKEKIQQHPPSFSLPSEMLDDIREIYVKGKLFVYPTETLYGLGANPFDENAMERLYTVKQRPRQLPVSISVPNLNVMENLGEVNNKARKIADEFLPGPVTLLIEAATDIPDILKKDNKVGIRVPNHPVALRILGITGPVTATSANIHGKNDPNDIEEAIKQLGDFVDLYIDSGESPLKGPSTIVDCTQNPISIIRSGVIPERNIRALFD